MGNPSSLIYCTILYPSSPERLASFGQSMVEGSSDIWPAKEKNGRGLLIIVSWIPYLDIMLAAGQCHLIVRRMRCRSDVAARMIRAYPMQEMAV